MFIVDPFIQNNTDKFQIGQHEGWELAVAVLNRLDETSAASPKIASLLDRISLVDSDRVDKVLSVCEDLEQVDQLRDIAERYADSLAEDTATYGDALIYYARARSVQKLKSNLNHLTGLCLLHSTSNPPVGGTDAKLEALINKDRAALRNLADADMDAASLLSSHLSGYATLRQFYDLRDASSMSSLTRRRAAATALCAVISSAADCIPGGLFDPEAETAIPAEGLLNLFGECLPLLGSGERIFTEKQVFALLGLVEDWQACPGRIHEEADGLLSASLHAYREEVSLATGPLTRQKKKEIVGDMSKSVGSSWDVLSLELAAAAELKGERLKRGWDWRKGVVGLHEVDCGERQIVGLVREGLVREVARGWSGGLGW